MYVKVRECHIIKVLKVTEKVVEIDFLVDNGLEVLNLDTCLFHSIATAYGDAAVVEAFVVNGDAERCTYGILTAIAFAY